jgi:hypothetical protein
MVEGASSQPGAVVRLWVDGAASQARAGRRCSVPQPATDSSGCCTAHICCQQRMLYTLWPVQQSHVASEFETFRSTCTSG